MGPPAKPSRDAAGRRSGAALARARSDLARSFARLSQRRYDLILGFPWTNQEEVVVRLPARMQVRHLPEARHLESPFGRFDLAVEQRRAATGTEVVVKTELRVDRHRIAVGDYAAFRRFCSK